LFFVHLNIIFSVNALYVFQFFLYIFF
jgi:hypothetical protein